MICVFGFIKSVWVILLFVFLVVVMVSVFYWFRILINLVMNFDC